MNCGTAPGTHGGRYTPAVTSGNGSSLSTCLDGNVEVRGVTGGRRPVGRSSVVGQRRQREREREMQSTTPERIQAIENIATKFPSFRAKLQPYSTRLSPSTVVEEISRSPPAPSSSYSDGVTERQHWERGTAQFPYGKHKQHVNIGVKTLAEASSIDRAAEAKLTARNRCEPTAECRLAAPEVSPQRGLRSKRHVSVVCSGTDDDDRPKSDVMMTMNSDSCCPTGFWD
ncbi:hypothetical protein F2P81_021368 [Scophthalmus maximus]|uniref:Uncharacterized protein n=1 Tax=Scophthalmus maximus TaxID=52904 RepID=A0A6A4S677_SCOMX|nr:hypothetical protein F2P81_021368 [Scophthalmus maximus]